MQNLAISTRSGIYAGIMSRTTENPALYLEAVTIHGQLL
jgi:hypothetical protein